MIYHFHQNDHIDIYTIDHHEETMIQYQQVQVLHVEEMMMMLVLNKIKIRFLKRFDLSYHYHHHHQVKKQTFDFVGKVY